MPRLRPPLQETQHKTLSNATKVILNRSLFWVQVRERSWFRFLTQNFIVSKNPEKGQHCHCIWHYPDTTYAGKSHSNLETSKAASSSTLHFLPIINPLSSTDREMSLQLAQPAFTLLPHEGNFKSKSLIYHPCKSSYFPRQPVWKYPTPSCFST